MMKIYRIVWAIIAIAFVVFYVFSRRFAPFEIVRMNRPGIYYSSDEKISNKSKMINVMKHYGIDFEIHGEDSTILVMNKDIWNEDIMCSISQEYLQD